MKIRGGTLFTEEIDKIIKELMKEYKHLHNPYVKICEKFPQYTPKQIRQRWLNHLDPRLCHEPLNNMEQSFIVRWVETNREPEKIHWNELIPEMREQFGKFRSHNRIKNFWYLRMRRLARIEENQEKVDYKLGIPSERKYHITCLSTLEPKYEPDFNFPYKVKPNFNF